MNKAEVIDALVQESGCKKKQVKQILNALSVVVQKRVQNGELVPLGGLGRFRAVTRKARTGRNPSTSHQIRIPAKTSIKFTVSKDLKAGAKKEKRSKKGR